MPASSFMLIAGEASGDLLGSELLPPLREALSQRFAAPSPSQLSTLNSQLSPQFFGAGGPRLQAAGLDLTLDMTSHSVIGISGLLRTYLYYRKVYKQLLAVACDRRPAGIVCIDFSGFNRRFAHGIRKAVAAKPEFQGWHPKLIQFVSPQVWASRADRAYQVARDFDLLLSIFPFEKDWYARKVPGFRVEFVGNPLVERYGAPSLKSDQPRAHNPVLLLLPGSRKDELRRHLPPMLAAVDRLRAQIPDLQVRMVLPRESLVELAAQIGVRSFVRVQTGNLPQALTDCDAAMASTGTVTMECAWFDVPTVALYKTSWVNFAIGKRIVKVNHLSMPNILAGEEVFPEFVQDAATSENLASATLALLRDPTRRAHLRSRLDQVRRGLGSPGAYVRAAQAIASLF